MASHGTPTTPGSPSSSCSIVRCHHRRHRGDCHAGAPAAKMSGNEASAIASMRAVEQRPARVRLHLRRQRLRRLARGARDAAGIGRPAASSARTWALDPATKSGYLVTPHARQSRCRPPLSATAPRWPTATRSSRDPEVPGSTGTRYFFSNGGSNIWQDEAPFPPSTSARPDKALRSSKPRSLTAHRSPARTIEASPARLYHDATHQPCCCCSSACSASSRPAVAAYVHYQLLRDPAYTSFCDVSATWSCAHGLREPVRRVLRRAGRRGRRDLVRGRDAAPCSAELVGHCAAAATRPQGATPTRPPVTSYLFAWSTVGLAGHPVPAATRRSSC